MLSSEDDGESDVYQNPFFKDDNDMVIEGHYCAPSDNEGQNISREIGGNGEEAVNRKSEGFFHGISEGLSYVANSIVSDDEGQNSNEEIALILHWIYIGVAF